MTKPDLAEVTTLAQTMAKDLIHGEVLAAYDAVERAKTAAGDYHRLLPMELDLGFRLKGVHESLFRIRADLEEL